MPFRRLTIDTFVRYHNSPSSLLNNCQVDFQARERDANIIYPFALKAAKASSSPTSPIRRATKSYFNTSDTESDESDSEVLRTPTTSSPIKKDEQFWLSQWSGRPGSPSARLDLVLACTNGPIDKYPIFLYSNVPDEELTSEFVVPRINLLVKRLQSCVSPKRVFSVFGPVPLTRAFVTAWSESTSFMPILDDPYYAAKHTFCNRQTLTYPPSPIAEDHELRLADASDLHRAADLCYGFAAGSAPFILSEEDGIKEAKGYIANRQLYVYDIHSTSASGSRVVDTSSIVCVTRTSSNVSAITKVYTNPSFRGRKCAEILVRHVCTELLIEQRKREVVLFVAHDNIAAEKVYARVGFQGLCGQPRTEGVNDWLEIGFEGSELGHW